MSRFYYVNVYRLGRGLFFGRPVRKLDLRSTRIKGRNTKYIGYVEVRLHKSGAPLIFWEGLQK